LKIPAVLKLTKNELSGPDIMLDLELITGKIKTNNKQKKSNNLGGMMRKLFSLLVVLVLITAGSTGLFSRVQVGDAVNQVIETAHPYTGGGGVVFEKTINWPEASYIALHFSKFDLAPRDYVEISSPDGKFIYTYNGKGKKLKGGEEELSEFWAAHIPGNTVVVRLYSKGKRTDYGFAIDKWVHGYEKAYVEAVVGGLEEETEASIEAICSADDKEWAKCYEGTDMYNESKAVARLLISGMYACTGWLVGSEGHLITNNHCIESQTDASNTDYEFMAEGSSCTTDCSGWGDCPGVVAATSGTLVKTSTTFDYSLVLLPTNVTSQYGYMQLRDSLPTVGERIYIPQHPSHKGKQIAVLSDVDGPYSKIYSTDEDPCMGGPGDIGYYADTEGGSSGSPVLAYSDNLVVALHHCALCPNRGVPIPSIIADLGALLPNDAVGGTVVVTDPPDAPSGLTANAPACNQVVISWNDNSDNESGFKIERSLNGSTFTQIATTGANATSYTDAAVSENTTYWYRVRATNSVGDSAYTGTASATTPTCPATPPNAPTLSLSKGRAIVYVNWTDNSSDEDGFRIYRGTSSTNLTLIATVSANTTSYTDSGLARRTYYYYKVCAYNANGEGCSSVSSVKTR
jgi:hypothetical protein